MIAALAATVALAAPGCHAPECLVQVGPDAPPSPLTIEARRVHRRLAVELSEPALLILRAGGRELDRWLAPAGRSIHPLPPARGGMLRLTAVDGAGQRAYITPSGPAPSPMRA